MNSKIVVFGIAAASTFSFAADPPAVAPTPPKPPEKTEAKIVEMPVFAAHSDKGKGILVFLPEALSASHRGTEFEFDYSIANTLEEAVFVETQPVDGLSIDYSDDSGGVAIGGGSFTMGPHGRRFALLSGSDYRTGERLISCCSTVSRKGRLKLPEGAKVGGKLSVTVYVRGYYLKNGQPFSGSIEAPIKLSE